jgi:formate hydrogenlyase transcriptional activator
MQAFSESVVEDAALAWLGEQLQHSFLEQVASSVAVALDDCLAHEEMRRLGNELSARTIAELERQQRHISDALQEASKALDASEERFRDLFDEAPIAYVHEGLDSRFIRANRTAMKILGIQPEDVPTTYGKTFVPNTPDAQRRIPRKKNSCFHVRSRNSASKSRRHRKYLR